MKYLLVIALTLSSAVAFALDDKSPIQDLPNGTRIVLQKDLIMPAGEKFLFFRAKPTKDVRCSGGHYLLPANDCMLVMKEESSFDRIFRSGDSLTVVYSDEGGFGQYIGFNGVKTKAESVDTLYCQGHDTTVGELKNQTLGLLAIITPSELEGAPRDSKL